MNFRLEIRPDAVEDITKAVAWYEDQEPGLGSRFFQEVTETIERLLPNPLLWRVRHRRLGARWIFPSDRFSGGW